MKVIHTSDGRTLYKDDQGHWLKKGEAEALIAKQNEDLKDQQIKQAQEMAKKAEEQHQQVDEDKDPFIEGENMKFRKNEKGGYTAGNGRFELRHLKGSRRMNIPGKTYSEIRSYNYWEMTDRAIANYVHRDSRFGSLKEAQEYINAGKYKRDEEIYGKKKDWWRKK